jgi:hypothetical protein
VVVTLIAARTQNVGNLPPGSLLVDPDAKDPADAAKTKPIYYTNAAGGDFVDMSKADNKLPATLPANLRSPTC